MRRGKMRLAARLELLLCAAIVAAAQQALSDDVARHTPAPEQQVQVHQQQPARHHPTMSCHVCSTMDYENTSDNLCRVMRPHPRLSPPVGGLYQQPQSHPFTTTTTTTSTTTSATTGDAATDEALASTPAAQLKPSAGSHRLSPPPSYIRTRPCHEDENFCSIVSVVRIEFANDTVVSRFWAMERNCSKSCNTGCMLIGERVRLRVCSQCCKQPNCNVGSGAPAMSAPSDLRLFALLVSLLLMCSRF